VNIRQGDAISKPSFVGKHFVQEMHVAIDEKLIAITVGRQPLAMSLGYVDTILRQSSQRREQ
jgi:hypothetical protein